MVHAIRRSQRSINEIKTTGSGLILDAGTGREGPNQATKPGHQDCCAKLQVMGWLTGRSDPGKEGLKIPLDWISSMLLNFNNRTSRWRGGGRRCRGSLSSFELFSSFRTDGGISEGLLLA